MSKDSLEHIIRKKFEGASTQVPSSAWSGIERQLGSAASTAAGGGSISLLAKVLIGAFVTSSLAVASVLITKTPSTEKVKTENPSEKPNEKELITTAPSDSENKSTKEQTEQVTVPNSKKFNSTKASKNQTSQKEEKLSDKQITTQSIKEQTSQQLDQDEVEESIKSLNEAAPQVTTEEVNRKEEVKPFVIPSKIISAEISEKPYTLEFKLNQLDDRSEVQWFINDEFINSGEELRHEQAFDADLTIMALITTEGEEPHSVFKNLKIELPIVLSIPNIFSPNGDLMNPEFTINQDKSRNVSSYTILVRNIKGELIFESTDNEPDWNGDLPNGNPAPVGTYYYIIEAHSALGQTKTEKGRLELKR